MHSTAVAEHPVSGIAVTTEQLELVRRTVASGASADELKLYLYDCQRQGVHPLDKLIHFTKRGGKYTPITSIDFMRTRAADTGEYAGSDDAVFAAAPSGSYPESATVTVWRLVQGQRCAFTATARWAEYYPSDAGGSMWRKMPHTMLAKCAEALALRKGFPRQLAGLYAKEELDQAGTGDAPAYVVTGPAPIIKTEPVQGIAAALPGVHVPHGAVLLAAVTPKVKGAEAELTASTGESWLTYKPQIAVIAEQACQAGLPVTLETRTSKSGNTYVVGIERVNASDDVPELPAMTEDDVAF